MGWCAKTGETGIVVQIHIGFCQRLAKRTTAHGARPSPGIDREYREVRIHDCRAGRSRWRRKGAYERAGEVESHLEIKWCMVSGWDACNYFPKDIGFLRVPFYLITISPLVRNWLIKDFFLGRRISQKGSWSNQLLGSTRVGGWLRYDQGRTCQIYSCHMPCCFPCSFFPYSLLPLSLLTSEPSCRNQGHWTICYSLAEPVAPLTRKHVESGTALSRPLMGPLWGTLHHP